MRPEDRLQSRCRMFLDACLLPPCWWSSIAHERKQTPRQGQMQKARGVKAGVPDVLIFDPPPLVPAARGAAIELKSSTGTTSAEQDVWLARLAAAGWTGSSRSSR